MSNNDNEMKINSGAGSDCGSFRKEERVCGVRGECSRDFVLPDYMGDIKRLLKYSASLTPCNKFLSGRDVSLLGIVTFKVLYLDGEDRLTEASFTSDFEHTEKMSYDFIDAGAEMRVQSVAVRLAGPRKISAKASVATDIYTVTEGELQDRSMFESAETKKTKIKIHSAEYCGGSEREYAEEIDRLADILADEIEVIKYDAVAHIDSVYPTDSGVNLSGYADAFCLLRVGDEIMRLEKRIPIEEGIETEKYGTDNEYHPKATVTGVTLNVNNATDEKDTGECAASVVMNMSVECGVTRHYNEEYDVVTDAFLEGRECSVEYRDFSYREMLGSVCEKAKISMVAPRGEEVLHGIFDWDAAVRNVKCEAGESEMKISCDLCVTLAAKGSEAEDCYPKKIEEPISLSYKINGLNESSEISVSVVPCEVSPSFDSEKIYVECYILVRALAEATKCERIVFTLASGEEERGCERCVHVYYTEREDTLWSVAKKYRISPAKIVKQNLSAALPENMENNISSVPKIIIAK